MLDLSPVKLLIVFVVAMVLLGPDKLPQVARQLGAGWRQLRGFHERVDAEVRENMPDLPSTKDIARIARSPVALLNKLAEMPTGEAHDLVADPGAPDADEVANGSWPSDPAGPDGVWVESNGPTTKGTAANGTPGGRPGAAERPSPPESAEPSGAGASLVVPDDPSMN